MWPRSHRFAGASLVEGASPPVSYKKATLQLQPACSTPAFLLASSTRRRSLQPRTNTLCTRCVRATRPTCASQHAALISLARTRRRPPLDALYLLQCSIRRHVGCGLSTSCLMLAPTRTARPCNGCATPMSRLRPKQPPHLQAPRGPPPPRHAVAFHSHRDQHHTTANERNLGTTRGLNALCAEHSTIRQPQHRLHRHRQHWQHRLHKHIPFPSLLPLATMLAQATATL